ncbi:transposase [Streptomyces xanthophaeus]
MRAGQRRVSSMAAGRRRGVRTRGSVSGDGQMEAARAIRTVTAHRQGPPPNHQGLGDTGHRTKPIDHGATLGLDGETTRRKPGQKGFKVVPRRWVVERTFGWLMNHRRLARDYETHPHRSEAKIRLAMVDLMSRTLTRESTPNRMDA